jgi:hypothetical protein
MAVQRAGRNRSDFFWYVLIGLLTVIAIGLFVIYVPESRAPKRKWTEFVFYSSFLFIFLAKFYWGVRRHLKLWLVMLGALLLHSSVYVPLLSRIDHWPSIAYLLLMPIEGMVIVLVVKFTVGVLPDPRVQL